MTRRDLLQGLLVTGLWGALTGRGGAAQPKVMDMKGVKALQDDWKTYLAAGYKAPSPAEPLKLAKEEWRKRLSPLAYQVLREEGTERAGTSPLNNEKREGVFVPATDAAREKFTLRKDGCFRKSGGRHSRLYVGERGSYQDPCF